MTLDAAFAAASATLAAQFGQPAVYTPPAGMPVATLASRPQRTVRVRADGMATEVVRVVRIPAADVPEPQRGARLVIGDLPYVIDGVDADDGDVVAVTVRPA